jgi:hypothetical protein
MPGHVPPQSREEGSNPTPTIQNLNEQRPVPERKIEVLIFKEKWKALRKLRQEDPEFKVSLGYKVRHCLKTKTKFLKR